MRTNFLQRLGIQTPIIQAPMAGATTPELAAAVANAGALGGHGCATFSVETTREHIRKIRSLSNKPFNINLFCHSPFALDKQKENQWISLFQPYFVALNSQPPTHLNAGYVSLLENSAMIEMLLEEKPPVVSFHFGLPDQAVIDALKKAGIILFGCATELEEAKAIEAARLDAIIVQGVEAGGHRGVFDVTTDTFTPLTTLLERIKPHTRLPLIAAGGIMTGKDIAAAMQAGAAAAQLGTAFLLCPEAHTTSAHRQALKQGTGADTAIIQVISGRPARGFTNRLYEDLEQEVNKMPAYPYPYSITKALNQAAKAQNNTDFAVHWAGTGVAHIRELGAAELVATLEQERQAAITL